MTVSLSGWGLFSDLSQFRFNLILVLLPFGDETVGVGSTAFWFLSHIATGIYKPRLGALTHVRRVSQSLDDHRWDGACCFPVVRVFLVGCNTTHPKASLYNMPSTSHFFGKYKISRVLWRSNGVHLCFLDYIFLVGLLLVYRFR